MSELVLAKGAEVRIPPTIGLGGSLCPVAHVLFVDGAFVRVRNAWGTATFTQAQLAAEAAAWRDRQAARRAEATALARVVGPRTPLTDLEQRTVAALSPARVTYPPATAQKRFARDIQGQSAITDRQRAYLWLLAWRFRRQIRDLDVLNEAAARNQPEWVAICRAKNHRPVVGRGRWFCTTCGKDQR